jgi:hypothetical protein
MGIIQCLIKNETIFLRAGAIKNDITEVKIA